MSRSIRIAAAFLASALLMPEGAGAATIRYGEVTSVSVTSTEDDDHVSGAVKGGLLGKAIGRRRPGVDRGVIAGAAMGAAADKADDKSLYLYTVQLVDGDGTIRIHTEQGDIRQGDCVSIEQGEHANIRRVSSVHCEHRTSAPPPHHAQAAKECDLAKQELMAASTDEEVDIAIKKVRVLCED